MMQCNNIAILQNKKKTFDKNENQDCLPAHVELVLEDLGETKLFWKTAIEVVVVKGPIISSHEGGV